MSHSPETRTSIASPPNPDDLRPHVPLRGVKGIAARAFIRRIPHAAGAALVAAGVIAAGITLTRNQDGVAPVVEQVASQSALPDIQKLESKVLEAPLLLPSPEVKMEKTPPVQQAAAEKKEVPIPVIVAPIETQVVDERKPLSAVPGIDSDMSSIDMGELASAVDSLGFRADQLEEALPKEVQSPVEQAPLAPQVQEPVSVETKTETPPDRKKPLTPAMSPEDAEVHKRLTARLADVQAKGDANGVKAAKAELDMFQATLDTIIEFRIIDRQGEKPGFWRTLVDDAKTKQFFVVVEAVVDGKPVNWAVRDADSGKVVSGARFGLRVDEKTFAELSADKKHDGRIDNMVVGIKPVGRITPVWSIKTDGETITEF